MDLIVSEDIIANRIFTIRGQKVMLDRHLAELYGVETKRLKEQVRRNMDRFPDDFMFELSKDEFENWRSQFATSNDKMGLRIPPFAFTEHGVLMLSSVLNSQRAIDINIQAVRIFNKLRRVVLDNEDIRNELAEFKEQTEGRFNIVFEALDQILSTKSDENKRKIGF
ncbi:MAG: ORF6N domain-containing protein [Bacteroidetes bacterium]|nr:ORF6N domain-containing protein [Bacteroidota bacterium]